METDGIDREERRAEAEAFQATFERAGEVIAELREIGLVVEPEPFPADESRLLGVSMWKLEELPEEEGRRARRLLGEMERAPEGISAAFLASYRYEPQRKWAQRELIRRVDRLFGPLGEGGLPNKHTATLTAGSAAFLRRPPGLRPGGGFLSAFSHGEGVALLGQWQSITSIRRSGPALRIAQNPLVA